MNVDGSSDVCPVERPSGVSHSQVDTTGVHGRAEVVMPVGTMDTISTVAIHHIRDIPQIIGTLIRRCAIRPEFALGQLIRIVPEPHGQVTSSVCITPTRIDSL
jgi:hypothetical protein